MPTGGINMSLTGSDGHGARLCLPQILRELIMGIINRLFAFSVLCQTE